MMRLEIDRQAAGFGDPGRQLFGCSIEDREEVAASGKKASHGCDRITAESLTACR